MNNLKELKELSERKYMEYLEAAHAYDTIKKQDSIIYNAYMYKYVSCPKQNAYIYVKDIKIGPYAIYMTGLKLMLSDMVTGYELMDDLHQIPIEHFDDTTGLSDKLTIISKDEFKAIIDKIAQKILKSKD